MNAFMNDELKDMLLSMQKSPYDHPFISVDDHVNIKKYINYLEVIIDEDGKIYYAVPSHQQALIRIACKKLKVTEQELNDMCPEDYYFRFNIWLSMQAKCTCVWTNFYEGVLNDKQKESLTYLKENGLYNGLIEGERL